MKKLIFNLILASLAFPVLGQITITFRLTATQPPTGTSYFIAGNFQGTTWSPSSTPMVSEGNNVWSYSATYSVIPTDVKWKFLGNNNWNIQENLDISCLDGVGGNRLQSNVTVSGTITATWNQCHTFTPNGTTTSTIPPPKFNFQAVIRENGVSAVNTEGKLEVAIFPSETSSTSDYSEIHNGVKTNGFGQLSVKVGEGAPQAGSNFSNIPWGTGEKWLSVKFTKNQGNTVLLDTRQQLVSVPYALYADKAKTAETANSATTAQTATSVSKLTYIYKDDFPYSTITGDNSWYTPGNWNSIVVPENGIYIVTVSVTTRTTSERTCFGRLVDISSPSNPLISFVISHFPDGSGKTYSTTTNSSILSLSQGKNLRFDVKGYNGIIDLGTFPQNDPMFGHRTTISLLKIQ